MADWCRFNRFFSHYDFRVPDARNECAYFDRRNSFSDSVPTRNRFLVRGLFDHFVPCDFLLGPGAYSLDAGLFGRREIILAKKS